MGLRGFTGPPDLFRTLFYSFFRVCEKKRKVPDFSIFLFFSRISHGPELGGSRESVGNTDPSVQPRRGCQKKETYGDVRKGLNVVNLLTTEGPLERDWAGVYM